MQLPTSIEYAIHGLIVLARSARGQGMLLNDIAESAQVPESYLRKVFQQLARYGIVMSQRGARGGYVLDRSPEDITLKEVVRALDGSRPLYNCISRERSCGITQNCPIKHAFEEARQKMYDALEKTSIGDLQHGITIYGRNPGWLKTAAAD